MFLATQNLMLVNQHDVEHPVLAGQELKLTETGAVVILDVTVRTKVWGDLQMDVQVGHCDLNEQLKSGLLVKK